MPDAQHLAQLRRAVDRKPWKLKRVLRDAGIRKHFLGSVVDEETKVVKAFVSHNSDSALKTKPKVSSVFFPIRSFALVMDFDYDPWQEMAIVK
jgi:hypothetical protein